jgi:predicted sulfurtransferase
MHKLLLLIAITTVAFVLACAKPAANIELAKAANVSAAPAPAHTDDAPRISLADAKKDFDAGTAIFIDTRDPAQYKFEHIKGAINITSAMLDDKLKDLPKDKKIIAYCS